MNYAAAVDVLKKKYGKETAIQRAHVIDLVNLTTVFSDKDTTRLRKLYDSSRRSVWTKLPSQQW